MNKKLLTIALVLAFVLAFSAAASADDFVKGFSKNLELQPDWIGLDAQGLPTTMPVFQYSSGIINEIVYVEVPCDTDRDGKRLFLAAGGYEWLMYLPLSENWCLNTFYTPGNEILSWYFDISKGNFLDENGMPCTDDIFLDLIIYPDGQTLTVDADELQEALDKQEITVDDYNHAYAVRDQILASKWNNVGLLKKLSDELLIECNM